jgi:hypothetical protein
VKVDVSSFAKSRRSFMRLQRVKLAKIAFLR